MFFRLARIMLPLITSATIPLKRVSMKILKLVFMLAVMGTGSIASNASASILFDFSGVCETDCSRFGLADGTAFEESSALALADGTDISAGATLDLSSIEYFNVFGIDFLTGNVFSPAPPFVSDGVLGGFILTGGTNNFCYHYPGTYCADGRFDTIVGSSGVAAGLAGHGPGEFTLSAVPEPATIALFSLGLLGAGAARRI